MDVKTAIEKRRAYRSLKPFQVDDALIEELAFAARLAPSCFNNQPWRFVFARDPETLQSLFAALSKGNEWARKSPLVIAVFSQKDYDCLIKEREYYLFDTGIAVAFLILRATELGLIAHPIAGYDPEKAKEALGIPKEKMLITLIVMGEKSEEIDSDLSEKQMESEKTRPERLQPAQFIHINKYDSQREPRK
ncbi:MAG: nitroreductase family protein [Myxococcota bacterium]